MLRWLVSAIGLAALREELQRAARRAALSAVAIVLWLVVFGFALAAFTVWLASIVGVIWALLIVAGVFALIAIVIHIIVASMAKKRKPVAVPLAELAASGTMPEVGVAGAIVAAAVLAFLLARQFRRR
jgi:hypothetical protein